VLYSIDKLAINQLMKLISEVNSAYSNRDFITAFSLISEFCQNELNDFYLKAVKDRLYESPAWSIAKQSAQTVLWNMATTIVRLIAPVTPFLAEQLWANLQQRLRCEEPWSDANMEFPSVFLADWPVPMLMIQQRKSERDWKKLRWFKTELTGILMDACHQGIIKDFKEADVIVYAKATETTEILQKYVQDLQVASSIAKLQISSQEPENTQELFQANDSAAIFFAIRCSPSQTCA
jgi:isoleucyl-tRNA synthetase